jgi:hypothetical protein
VQAGSSGTAVVQKCPVNFLLESSNKGFEGAHVFTGKDGSRYLIGLCEGERCLCQGIPCLVPCTNVPCAYR